jgi:hypothetical protein
MEKSYKGKQVFDKARDYQLRDIAYGDKITEPKTGKELYQRFNEKDNYDIITEYFDKETANDLLKTFEKIGDKEVNKSSVEKAVKQLRTGYILKSVGGFLFVL